ncbi:MAG: hypothetical protein QW563_03835 [Candidatus Methanomethylicia archaeon]
MRGIIVLMLMLVFIISLSPKQLKAETYSLTIYAPQGVNIFISGVGSKTVGTSGYVRFEGLLRGEIYVVSASSSTVIDGITYYFSYWSMDITSRSNPIEITIWHDMEIKANYGRYKLTVKLLKIEDKSLPTDTKNQAYIEIDGWKATGVYEDYLYVDKGTYTIKVAETLYINPQSRYLIQEWSDGKYGSSRTVSVSGDKTLKAYYKLQYYLNVSSPYGIPSGGGWHDEGVKVSFSISSPVYGGWGVRYVCIGYSIGNVLYSGSSGTVTMNSPYTVYFQWKTQYILNIVSNPPGVIAGLESKWYDSGSIASVSVPSTIYANPSTKYVFTGWSGDLTATSPEENVVMDKAKTIIANYKTQYAVDIKVVGREAPASLNLVVNGESITASIGHHYVKWIDADQTLTISVPVTIDVKPDTRYRFKQWIGGYIGENSTINVKVDSPIIIAALYELEFKVTVESQYGVANGSGWYSRGTAASISIDPIVTVAKGVREVFKGWSIDVNTPRTSITVNQPLIIKAQWSEQYSVRFKFKDFQERIIIPKYIIIQASNNSKVILSNYDGVWLDKGVHKLESVVLDGVNILAETVILNISSPLEVIVKCKVYDVEVNVKDILGLPISNCSISIIFINGTRISKTADYNGVTRFLGLPEGFYTLIASHLEEKIVVFNAADRRVNVVMTFSWPLITIITIIATAIIIAVVVTLRRRSKR